MDPVVISSESMNERIPVHLFQSTGRGQFISRRAQLRSTRAHCRYAPGRIPLEATGLSHRTLHTTGRRTVPGWKSDMLKHIFLSGWKRPDGVSIC